MSSRRVHLVGSIPLPDPTSVFTQVTNTLGPHITAIPDGETGARLQWLAWLEPTLKAAPCFVPGEEGGPMRTRTLLRVGPGIASSDIVVPDLGYAKEALRSFSVFEAMQRSGELDQGLRFQVGLPSPLAILMQHIDPPSRGDVLGPMEKRWMHEVETIVEHIPHEKLSLQLEVPMEIAVMELGLPVPFDNRWENMIDRLVRMVKAVPSAVELGFHMCYGDHNQQHFKEPSDLGLAVDMYNAIVNKSKRDMDFVHFPVPHSRTDTKYFEPLKKLLKSKGTVVFLGLVHFSDGLDGARRRATAAKDFIHDFGVSTECGLGRGSPEAVSALLELHLQVATSV